MAVGRRGDCSPSSEWSVTVKGSGWTGLTMLTGENGRTGFGMGVPRWWTSGRVVRVARGCSPLPLSGVEPLTAENWIGATETPPSSWPAHREPLSAHVPTQPRKGPLSVPRCDGSWKQILGAALLSNSGIAGRRPGTVERPTELHEKPENQRSASNVMVFYKRRHGRLLASYREQSGQ